MVQALSREGSDILTAISIAGANVNFINFTRETCVKVNSLIMVLQARNMLEKTGASFAPIYVTIWFFISYTVSWLDSPSGPRPAHC
jgi:hypothetical protein